MIRALIRIGLSLAGSAIGLWIASIVLDDMSISGTAFLIAVVIFTVLTAVLQPLVSKVAEKNAPALESASALISTFLALVITTLVSDGLSIEGAAAWILATVLVWLFSLIAGVVLVRFVVKDTANRR